MRELPLLDNAFAETNRSLRLMAAMVESLAVHKKNMARAADAHWSTATNLADQIVRGGSLSFREAHSLVARLVRLCVDKEVSVRDVTSELLSDAARMLGIPGPGLSTEVIRNSLDARAFVNSRTSLGERPLPK